nr:hypothetical protein Iba_chr08aCG5310 [Ipomoea batatas]
MFCNGGSFPENLLSPRCKDKSPVMAPKELGISPCRLLLVRSSIVNPCRSPKHLGNVPDNSFEERSMTVIRLTSHKNIGISPSSWLLESMRTSSVRLTPFWRGILPARKLSDTSQRSTSVGMGVKGPSNLLECRINRLQVIINACIRDSELLNKPLCLKPRRKPRSKNTGRKFDSLELERRNPLGARVEDQGVQAPSKTIMFQKMLGWDPALSYKKAEDTLNHESSEMMLFLALASLRSKYFRLVKLKMESGMEVLKKLEERPRAVREVNLPKTSGILPLKPFPSSLRCFRLEMLNSQRGKAELMMLYRRSNETRDVKFARGRAGILPTLQLDRFNNEREGSMLIALNQSLASPSWTPDKSKCSKDESVDTHPRLSAANLLVQKSPRSSVIVHPVIIKRSWIVKMKLLNMACFVVANYTFPGTAIFSLPRCKPVRFVYDGVFEVDECSSFSLDAGCTASKVEAFHETK